MIYRLAYQVGEPGETRDTPAFFRRVLSALVTRRFYDHVPAPDAFWLYTTLDAAQLRRAIVIWFEQTPDVHDEAMVAWIDTVASLP